MQIFLHQLDGSSSVATINENDSLEAFLINNNLCGFRLVSQGTVLTQDNLSSTLFENINVYLTSDLDGGKKKKKKKVYTTKKKNKHIHKKIPGLTLSLYSVDGKFSSYLGKGNVTQTRKTCPSCGPGIFMAQHWDRYYCGSCHTTIKMDA
jgi:ribosomal protein S27AE